MPGTWVRSRTKRDAETLVKERRRFFASGGYQTWTKRQRRLFWLIAPVAVALAAVVSGFD